MTQNNDSAVTIGSEDTPFEKKMERLTAELRDQMDQAARLDTRIRANLEELGCGLPT